MLIVKVYHSNVHVATVRTPETTVQEALEYAFRWTNNIHGSWSIPENPDYNDRVTVHAPLPVHDGRTFGLRSSMVGDTFIVDDTTYAVAIFGFQEVSDA